LKFSITFVLDLSEFLILYLFVSRKVPYLNTQQAKLPSYLHTNPSNAERQAEKL